MAKSKGGNIPRLITGAGPRLKEELKRAGVPVTTFREEMERRRDAGRRVGGTAYSTVHGYLQGRVEPTAEFLREAADYLQLREAYLSRGELPRTEEEIDEEEVGAAALGRRWTHELSDALEEELGGVFPKVAHAVVAHHWRRLHRIISNIPGEKYSGEDLVRKMAKALVAPLRAFDDDNRWTSTVLGAMQDEQRADYLIGVVPAVSRALEHRFRVEGVDVIMKTLVTRERP
jgi:transcriptional regulator with XRE-family HTH domain